MTASLPHPGQRTPSGQRCWRTSAKHLASSNSSERLTRSDEGMTARAPCATAAADQPPASSQQKPHATATRSPASQHPGSQQEPPPLVPGEIVATGKLTRALPIKSAERWSTRLDGLLLAASGSDLFRTPGRHPPATDYCRHFLAQIARAQLGPGRSTAAMQDTLLSSKPTMSPRSQVPFTANSLVPHLATHR